MNRFIYLVTEGVLDVVFLSQILCAGYGGKIAKHKSELPPEVAGWLDRFKWPIGNDIARRAVPAPAIVVLQDNVIGMSNGQGLTRIKEIMKADWEAFLRMDLKPAALGIILDADDKPVDKRFSEFAALLEEYSYPRPDRIEAVAQAGVLRAGIFSFPGNAQQGSLEDLLLPLAEIRFPALHPHAATFVNSWCERPELAGADFEELRSRTGPRKAALSAAAALLKPGKPLSASIEDQKWIPDNLRATHVLTPLMKFLDQLMQT